MSPYAAIANIRNSGLEFKTSVCVKTIYNYLDKDLFLHISNKDLLVKRNKKKHDYHKIRRAIINTRGRSISERPVCIDKREEYGHWEMDTVVGRSGTKAALLVLSERQSRQELIFKLQSKTQEQVCKALDRLERHVGKDFDTVFKTITCDNGCEFLNFAEIEASVRKKSPRT